LNARSLELSPEEMRRLGYRVIDLLVDHFANMKSGPVGRKADPADIWPLLAERPPDAPSDAAALLDFLAAEIFPSIMHVDHPRFFAFVPSPGNFVSAMADALAAGFNVFNGTWLGGSAAAALELAVVEWLREICGFPAGAGGLFVSGGSVANITALAVARRVKLADDVRGATVYFSDQTHSSVERAFRVLGFLPDQMRKMECDREWRLPLHSLHAAVQADRRAGLRPFCMIANAGTTNTGAVDPLTELAEFAEAEDLWLHADGAYGAAAVVCERGRAAVSGLERADSLSLDPHKWLFQTFECGCVLVRDAEQLKSTFQIMPDYLRDVHRGAAEVNPCDYGIQLTRSFRALKIWLSMKTFGLDAFRAAITRGFELAEFAEARLREMPYWEVVSPAHMGIVCFRFAAAAGDPNAFHTRLVDCMLADGFAFATSTTLRGATVLRFCTINPRTTETDIEDTLARIDRLATKLSRE
jgi:glutamate/tyrosine decarboxylase-like PLP-dependent enzyme